MIDGKNQPYVELNTFLKIKGIAPTGGQVKNFIRSGKVFLNGNIETRNRKKLYENDCVMINDELFVVDKTILR